MRVLLVTQNDHFLINQYSIELLRNLRSLAVDVDVLITPVSSHGKKASLRENIVHVRTVFGWSFLLAIVAATARGHLRFNFLKWCRTHGVRTRELGFGNINGTELVQEFAAARYDSALILAGNRIIKRNFLDAFQGNVVNVHSSLLPFAKGLMPAFWTMKAEQAHGVTLFRLNEEIDGGEILKQVSLAAAPRPTYLDYLHRTKRVGINLLLWYVMSRLEKPRDPAPESYCKYPVREDVDAFRREHRLT